MSDSAMRASRYKLIDRYILGKYVRTFLVSLLLIMAIIITFDVSEKLDDFIRNDAPLNEIIFKYYFNFIPNFFNLYCSLFIFIAVVFFTSKLAQHTEIIAILGSGLSYKRFLRPYLHGSLLFALVMLGVSNFVIPRSNVHLKEFEGMYIKTNQRTYYSELHFQSSPGVQVYVQSYDVKNRAAVYFHRDEFDSVGNLVDRITAHKIEYDSTSGKWNATSMHHRTFDGEKENLHFAQHSRIDLKLTPEDFNQASKQITTMNSIELLQHIKRETMRGSGAVTAAKIEFWQRIINPLSIIVMTFIGVTISSRKKRGGIGVALAIGIALAFGLIVFMRICVVFAEAGEMTPFVAILLPQLLFGIAAGYMIRQASK